MIPDSSEILRAQKFDQLMRERAEQYPNEGYDLRFNTITSSAAGEMLVDQMHRSELTDENEGRDRESFASQFSDAAATSSNVSSSIPPVGGYRTSAEAKVAFMREFEKLHQHLSYDQAWNTAAGTTPSKEAYIAWKTLSEKEKNLPPPVRTPAYAQLPADAATKFRD